MLKFAIAGLIVAAASLQATAEEPDTLPEKAPALSQGLLGCSEADLAKTDFFSFFHFQATGQPTQQGHYTIKSYATTGNFKAYVQVKVTYDPQGKAVRMEEFVARQFIDSPETKPFANDVIASFLRDATPKNDRAATARAFDQSSAGRRVLQGNAPTFTQKNQESRLKLAAVEIDGKSWVELSVTAR